AQMATARARARNFMPQRLLPAVHGNTSVGTLRTAERARLQGHKDVIGELVDRNAVRIGACGHIDQPSARCGINHAHHRSVRHIPTRRVVAVVAWVEPDFVRAPTLINGGHYLVCHAVKDDQQRREWIPSWPPQPTRKSWPGP